MVCVFEISAVQVKPLCPSVSCSTEDLGASFHPPFITSTPIKRPRMKNSADEINTCTVNKLVIGAFHSWNLTIQTFYLQL